jgi:hypothetical protein
MRKFGFLMKADLALIARSVMVGLKLASELL